MRRTIVLSAVAAALIGAAAAINIPQGSFAAGEPMVGGAAMYPAKNIIENAVNSKDHTTLVTAVKAAGLVDTCPGPGRSRSSRRPTRLSTSCRRARSRCC